MIRRKARRDANHAAVVKALEMVGCKVQDLAAVGEGCPDLLIGIPTVRQMVFCEIKDGDKPPCERKLTPAQVEWHREWSGYPVHIVESVSDALAIVAAIKRGEL
jgi:hypothetical protein